MKSVFIITILCFNSLFIHGQIIKSWSEIESQVTNSKSKFYYPDLIKRYNNFDNSLTDDDYAYIYLGYVFEEDYIKYRPDEKRMSDLKDDENYTELMKECQLILNKNPVSLKANKNMAYALYKLGKEESEWRKYQNRYRVFRKIIALSGDGLTPESALKVIYVSDEYNMIYSYFEIDSIEERNFNGNCDYFKVTPSKYYKSDEIYFDISKKLMRTQELINGN